MDPPMPVFRLPALPLPSASPFPDFSYDIHRSKRTPIVIDNGSSSFRWGFASAPSPYVAINAVAKYKERKNNKLLLLFGEAIDAENGAKGQTRTPWEGDVLLNFDALVRVSSLILRDSVCTKIIRKTLWTMLS